MDSVVVETSVVVAAATAAAVLVPAMVVAIQGRREVLLESDARAALAAAVVDPLKVTVEQIDES